MVMRLDGQLALVTGGGRGIGAAICEGLATAGAEVIVTDIDGTSAGACAARIAAAGGKATAHSLDVTDRAQLTSFSGSVAAEGKSVSILVNNAGVFGNAKLGDANSAALWDQTILVNLTGAFNVTEAFLPALKSTRGCIINVSSVVAFTSGFASAAYTASKGGVKSLTQIMCRELAPFGIRVNAVAPGYIDTAMGGKGDPDTEAWLSWHCPMRRHGLPSEVADPVVFLASPSASFVNGVTLPIDGGYLSV
jgi:NAD(P)-dependent dehydrogenase (short-subunit alcohol dehydrogenase family)